MNARPAAGPRRCACALDQALVTVVDRLCGPVTAVVDDLVLRRNDGVAAYNLAVVVDDDAQGIGEVVRGDDLLASTPRQVHLARLLGIEPPVYAHVPLVLGLDGERLAKRDGAVTLSDRRARGESPDQVRTMLAASLGLVGTRRSGHPRRVGGAVRSEPAGPTPMAPRGPLSPTGLGRLSAWR